MANKYMYKINNLRCEYLKTPLAVEALHPRLSWEGDCSREGAAQSAYRIVVADSPGELRKNSGNLWDSGRVESNQSLHVCYRGKALGSSVRVFWKVMVWDEHGRAGSWSKISSWTMGILKANEWKGFWIGNELGNSKMSPLLRKEFKVGSKIQRALLYASALGLYHIQLNGKEISDDVFAPGWTDYAKRRYYRCYDVTALLKQGKNCIAAELADGWYKGTLGWDKRPGYGTHIALLSQLNIEYQDGTLDRIISDSSWKSTFGFTLQSGFYEGESVDAQLEPKGWQKPNFIDTGWSDAVELAPANDTKSDSIIPLQAYPAEPVRRTEEIRPVKFWAVAPGKIIYDFGQNFAGRVRIHFKGKAGNVIRMRFGEMVNQDKTLYVDNLRSALSTDTYVMKGRSREVWEPKFTFHGFRYVELSGSPVPANLDNLTGVVIGSDTSRVGDFECSNQMLNQLYSNAVWTQRANFLEVPTDCPQRDERLGWTGDAQVFIRTSICNMDTAAFFTKWMNDLIDAQTKDGAFPNVAPNILADTAIANGDAAWGDAGVICPWVLYQCYEDKILLSKMYPYMKLWIAYLKKTSKEFLRSPEITHTFGDWLSIKAETPNEIVQTAYFAHAADITRKAAEALGKTSDAAEFKALYAAIKAAFNKAFVAKNGKIKGETQTGYLLALKFGLLENTKATQAVKHLVADIQRKNNHTSCGFVGTGLLLSVLRDCGHLDLAYKLLENTTFPSWGYSVVNGATTIWERWDGWTTEGGPGNVNMNSYSHYAYGAVVEWMFDTVAGIDHCGEGFQHFILRPQPGGSLNYAKASYHSPYGIIKSAWHKNKKDFVYDFTIPSNTKATIIIPEEIEGTIIMNGEQIAFQSEYILPAGDYNLTIRMKD